MQSQLELGSSLFNNLTLKEHERGEKVRKVQAFPGGWYTPCDGNAPTDLLGQNDPDGTWLMVYNLTVSIII